MKGSFKKTPGRMSFPTKTNIDGVRNRDRQRHLREMLVYFLFSVAMARRSKALRASPVVLGEVPRGRILGGGATAADPRFKSEMTRVARASCWSMASRHLSDCSPPLLSSSCSHFATKLLPGPRSLAALPSVHHYNYPLVIIGNVL